MYGSTLVSDRKRKKN